jgi:hypothetical protein
MVAHLSFTEVEQFKIKEWKHKLPAIKGGRKYRFVFVPTDLRDEFGYIQYKFIIKSTDGHTFVVDSTVTL